MPDGTFFQGGPRKNTTTMIWCTAAFREEGKLPAEASLMFSQLLLNVGGAVGRKRTEELVSMFLQGADVPA